ncbi:MAG: hypothetical protein A3C70_00710 [Candidatus Zambryskibacteria bacterium RIFCSPHIGHO2_02_FULL_43_14]|uniref:PilN domain-containing protein n=1 Tax=Candidatus Zambryskibacteria bacterium RIFCSPHIGHO2_02_FULL_43_14 TaxID=1802748 RepID=A0A1G2TDZ6_9BACT|nr:MAG: hypothetical protein A2829_02755 [Candidatus Zambryskibacteria bacterium RIFCSPHIGHO2_01_FULL_43_60]OHA95535.1 MAG: hypothetical protein A3C70_00710 [Candidatus Zambryskibacteria bacterium RIFCSPHIGHO2_02_FULL_43_14]OHB02889.1 MAG: hypothetical protein A3B03_03150 [Candidatus Zambryskibacteria bacterium RIFCSPLOWO2_01_FULL_42_41]
MFKLLTDEEKQKVAHEYVLRRVIVILFALILVLIIGIVGLLPSYILSDIRENEMTERTRIVEGVGQKGGEVELQAWLEKINRELQILSPVLDTDRPSIFIEKIIDQKVSGTHITGFSWVRVKDEITLSINGVALDRQTLIAFENGIKSSGYFSEVTLPVSNLAKDRNIDFQIKFSLATSASRSLKTP